MREEQVYADPSALARLYFHQDGSREMAAWRTTVNGALQVTHHGRVEIVNAICQATFLGYLNESSQMEALSDLQDDFATGRLVQADILWRAALNRAADLSLQYTPALGVRALDVLHVACAVEMKHRNFLTFDLRQRQLAKAIGLKVIVPN